MKKWACLTAMIAALTPSLLFATPAPIISIFAGSDHTNVYSTKSITILPPFQNSYIGINNYDTEPVMGLLLGAEMPFANRWAWQLGLSYFQSSVFTENGNVYQFSDPNFNNFTYQYHIQSRRVSIETRLSPTIQQVWHPFITLSGGEAINKTYGYVETPVTSADVPMAQPFANHTTHSFTYSAGLGFDVNIATHVRIGVSYRFADLGNASLGTTPLQSSNNTLSNSHLRTNEFLAQLTYVG